MPVAPLQHNPELAELLALAYGGLPPPPDRTDRVLLHRAQLPGNAGAALETWRIVCGSDAQVQFSLQVLLPPQLAAVPVLLCGDGCWATLTEAVKAAVLARGFALAWFNRVEVAEDPPAGHAARSSPLYHRHPKAQFGALSAWAWAYHRAIDALVPMDGIDGARIAIAGHSRGGKAALIAGATDTRIWLIAANNSGTGGTASYAVQGPGSETLDDLLRAFPHWLGPAMAGFAARPEALPFDQHVLLAAIAPRRLLITQAGDDAWANPPGTAHAVALARPAFEQAGQAQAIRLVSRMGGHPHVLADWLVLLDFAAS